MERTISNKSGYVVAALLGAAGGGLVVIIVTGAIPWLMKRMMQGMMENMRAQMSTGGCQPDEM